MPRKNLQKIIRYHNNACARKTRLHFIGWKASRVKRDQNKSGREGYRNSNRIILMLIERFIDKLFVTWTFSTSET